MINSLNIGLSGLLSAQKAIDTTSHNISNANTKGYNKEKIIFENNQTSTIGNGVSINKIYRNVDDFLINRKNKELSLNNYNEELNKKFKELNSILNEKETSNTLSDLIDKYFISVSKLNTEPNNNSIKIEVDGISKSIIERKNSLNNIFDYHSSEILKEINNNKLEANKYIENLETITKEINIYENTSNITKNPVANDLRDKRDYYEEKLNELGSFKSFRNNYDNKNMKYEEYNYEWRENSGKIGGLKESLNGIIDIKNKFNDSFKELEVFLNQGSNVDTEKVLSFLSENNKGISSIKNTMIQVKAKSEDLQIKENYTSIQLNNLRNDIDNKSKVNIDEELTNLIKYKNWYSSNAKLIQASDEMLKTLLSIKQ